MTHMHGTELHDPLAKGLVVGPLGVDSFSALRYLHASALPAQTVEVLTDQEVKAFVRLVYSPAYADLLLKEETYGAWFDGELVGTASWQVGAGSGAIARIGSVFVRHPRLGIGRRVLAAAEARAEQCGFSRFAAYATANAVPFFERLGYQAASRGIKTLSPECVLPVTFLKKTVPSRRLS